MASVNTNFGAMVALQQLNKTNSYIERLEPIMRKLVNAELDKHENRIRYYWAQSRLAKARLYDRKLLLLEQNQTVNNDSSTKIKKALNK